MLENIKTYGPLPRDALHVALMQRLNLTAMASDDIDPSQLISDVLEFGVEMISQPVPQQV